MLLSASNYTMQVLCSPTRHDVDVAHAKREWLDIGLLSFRNLRTIRRSRAILWSILAFSSIPLHLFYNAAVFQIATYNEYSVISIETGSEKWLELNSYSQYRNFTNAQWSRTYDTQYVSEHGDLYLAIDRFAFPMSEQTSISSMSTYWPLEIYDGNQDAISNTTIESPDWIRYDVFQDLAKASATPNNLPSSANRSNETWPISARVVHAFASIVQPKSRIQISLDFMIVVIVSNALKLAVMVGVLLTDRYDHIVTIGDAAASLLEHPDAFTRNQCMLGKEEMLFVRGRLPYHTEGDEQPMREHFAPRVLGTWLPQTQRYFAFVGRDRQVFFALLFCSIFSANILVPLIGGAGNSYSAMRSWGTSSGEVLPTQFGALFNAWFVNLPQLILSLCYLVLNSICTSIASAEEWNNLAATRKGLRVTQPKGKQRSTYFLQLPHKWALPLLITGAALHWLLSQSFFLVRLDVIDRDNNIVSASSKSACCFSRLSLWIFFVVAGLLLCIIGGIGLRQMKQKLPLAASCSLVISAACHPPKGDKELYLSEVKWGVTGEQFEEWYGHCSLTSRPTKKRDLVEGRIYR